VDVLERALLEAMRQVPRELFVPRGQRYRAYAMSRCRWRADSICCVPACRQAAAGAACPSPGGGAGDRGRQADSSRRACAPWRRQVRSLEIFPELADAARRNLAALGMRDVEVLDADALNADSGARYDAIAVTASLPLYDARFERMLTPGGRLFVVVGEAPVMDARLVRRTAEDAWSLESLFETVIDPLVNAVRPPGFTF